MLPAVVLLLANATLADGKGKWWEGLDPRQLHGIDLHEDKDSVPTPWTPPKGIFTRHKAYSRWYVDQWALRMLDMITKYDPDFIYTDGNDTQPFTGYQTGTGSKCDAMQRVMASFYNRTLNKRGAATNEQARELDMNLDFLPPGSYQATIIQDGEDGHYQKSRETLRVEKHKASPADTLRIKLAPGGGACLILEKQPINH